MAAPGRPRPVAHPAGPTGGRGRKSGGGGPFRGVEWRCLGFMGVLSGCSWPFWSLDGGVLAAGGPVLAPCLSARRHWGPILRALGPVPSPSLPSVANPHPGFGPVSGSWPRPLPEKRRISQKALCRNSLNRLPFTGFEPMFACGRGSSSLPLWQPTQVHRRRPDSPARITSAQAPDQAPSPSRTLTSCRAGRGGNVRPPAPASGPSGFARLQPRPSPTPRPRPTPLPACDRARG